jgi:hypothetical protein
MRGRSAMAEKKVTEVKSVSLADVKAADAQTGVKPSVSAQSGTPEAKKLDKQAKKIDRKEKTTTSKDDDKWAKTVDKEVKLQIP